MPWLILALISVITVSIATILERVILKADKSDPVAYAIVFQFLLGSIVLLFTLVLGGFKFPTFTLIFSTKVLFTSMLWAASTSFVFYAMKYLSAGEVTVLSSSNTVVSILLGVLFLNEVIGLKMGIGVALVLLSIFIVKNEKLQFESKRGVVFSLLAALCSGTAIVIDASVVKSYDVFSYVTIISFLPGIILMSAFPHKISLAKQLIVSKTAKLMLIFTFFYSLQAVTYYLAYQNGAPISHLSPITKSSIILTVVLGAIFLHERKNLLQKMIAAVIVTLGVVLLG